LSKSVGAPIVAEALSQCNAWLGLDDCGELVRARCH
jgi:hypothetical protein